MKLDHLALDIETIPLKPLSAYSAAVQAFVHKKIERALPNDPDMTYEKFASINADFGRVLCISLGYVKDGEIRLKSLCDEEERTVLTGFNDMIRGFDGVFVHFNGLGFDVPFILRRMAHHGIQPSNASFSDLYRFQQRPHVDIMVRYYQLDQRSVLPLGILDEVHGLPSPKGDMRGADVYAAYLRGELDRISRYCEFDVATTINLWRKVILFQETLDCELYRTHADVVPKRELVVRGS
jgi:predicted PolB exonuclease-like 3'-5' exonuclease